MRKFVALLVSMVMLPYAAADCSERASQVWAKCSVCHSVNAADGHGAAPNLSGIVGKRVGKQAEWKYSRHLRRSEATWTEEHLSEFLASPWDVYPGTSMAFAGLKKTEDREDVICYLKEYSQ